MKLITLLSVLICVSFAQVTGLSNWDIFIDPGHSQTQNMGVSGFSEAEEVLRVALHLQDLLINKTDIQGVYLSRTNDEQLVSLTQRTDMANSLNTNWYHSIHSNAQSNSSVTTTLLLWGQLYNGTPDPPVGGEAMSAIMIDVLTDGMRIPSSGSWGDCSFYGTCSAGNPGPYLHVNRNSIMPSELSEEGHHSNPGQNQLMMNSEYQRLMAYTFFWSILDYHGLTRPYAGICTGIVRDGETGLPLNGATVEIDQSQYVTDTFESLFHNYTSNPEALRNGFYWFEDLPDTILQVITSKDGYRSDTSTVIMNNNFFTFLDMELISSVPTHVTETYPVSNEPSHNYTHPIFVTFSRSMNTNSVLEHLQVVPEIDANYVWINSMKELRIYPSTLDTITTYTLTIADSTIDAYGTILDGDNDSIPGGDYILQFTTSGSDVSAPHIMSIYPTQNMSSVEMLPLISIIYDEEISNPELAVTAIRLENNSNATIIPASITNEQLFGKSIFSIFPQLQLDETTFYRLFVDAGFMDIHGNIETQDRSYLFSTTSTNWNSEIIDGFDSTFVEYWQSPVENFYTNGIIENETFLSLSDSIVNLFSDSPTAMNLHFSWDTSAAEWLVNTSMVSGPGSGVIFDDNIILQAYVFGDGNGNKLRFCVSDNYPNGNEENREVGPWITMDWYGWKLIQWNLRTEAPGSWIGNGILDGDLIFNSMQLTYQNSAQQQGNIIIDDLRIVTESEVSDSKTEILPTSFYVSQNYPNPFNPETVIRINSPYQSYVTVHIYDVNGHLVKKLYEGTINKGATHFRWNGFDTFQQPASSGVYFYSVQSNSFLTTRKMTLLR